MKSNSLFAIPSSQVKTKLLFAILLGLFVSSPLFATQPADIPQDVKETIRDRVDSGHNASIVVGIVSPSGTQYYSYGKATLSGNQKGDENTIFEIGSFTKVFTALLLADMVERRQVAFDDPIEKYLPKKVNVPTRGGKSITLTHLATHTSGLPRMSNNMTFSNPSDPYADYTVERMYDFLSNHTLTGDIGEKYGYSNYGMGLLGHILALTSGTSYEELLKQRITNRLSMRDTGITLSAEMGKRLAKGHAGNTEVPGWHFLAFEGAPVHCAQVLGTCSHSWLPTWV